jgi:CRISPR system Cascade subunit CasE
MYLSKLVLRDRSSKMLRALGDTHAMHRFICLAFPNTEDGGTGRILYRVERAVNPRDIPTILVQSEKEPDTAAWEDMVTVEGPKPWTPALATGKTLRFRLRANPTVKKRFDENSSRPGHRRVGLYKEEEQREWLKRKESESGFTLLDFNVIPMGQVAGRKATSRSEVIIHLSVEFEGFLQISNVESFQQTLKNGVGSAKGFGFGLLSIAAT